MPLDLSKLATMGSYNSSARRNLLVGLRPAADIARDTFRIKALLVGDSGSGKSTSACTAPGRKLVVEADKRSESLAGFPDVQIFDANTWDDVTSLIDELWVLASSPEPFPFDTIIFDSLTSLGYLSMQWALDLTDSKGKLTPRGLGGVPSQQHYFPQMYALSQLCHSAIPLPCNIIFCGHLDIYEDKILNTIDFFPKVTGKIRSEVSSWFNETYLCFRKGGAHYWATAPFQRYSFLKSAINKLGRYWSGDILLDFSAPPTGFAHILNLRFPPEKGGQPETTPSETSSTPKKGQSNGK